MTRSKSGKFQSGTPSRLPLIFSLLFTFTLAFSQPPFFRTYNYVDKYSRIALEEMMEYKIPASVILAQAVLESRSGTSELANRSNNHFGIKCHSQWTGDTILKDDDSKDECFRRYETVEQSYTDHSVFLRTRDRYLHLFALPIYDYKSWCFGLKAAGYATNPTYAEELIKLIEETKLFLLDGVEVLYSKKLSPPATLAEAQIRYNPVKVLPLKSFTQSDLLFNDALDLHIRSVLLYIAQNENGADAFAEK